MPHTSHVTPLFLNHAHPQLLSFVSLWLDFYCTERVTVDTLSEVLQLCSFYATLIYISMLNIQLGLSTLIPASNAQSHSSLSNVLGIPVHQHPKHISLLHPLPRRGV